MKKKTLLTAYTFLIIIFCSCLFLTALSIKSDLQAALDSGDTYTDNRTAETEEETNDFISWKSVSHHLFTFNR